MPVTKDAISNKMASTVRMYTVTLMLFSDAPGQGKPTKLLYMPCATVLLYTL